MSVQRSAGYTLMEILVVVAIVSIVTAMAVPGFRTVSMNSSISSVSSELVQVVNTARNQAVVTRANVLLLQGPGTSATDVTAVTAGDWVRGWRMVRSGQVVFRNMRTRAAETGELRITATDGGGTNLNGIGFTQFGRLVDGNGANLTQAVITICAPKSTKERGRTLTVTLMGRVINTPVDNPAC